MSNCTQYAKLMEILSANDQSHLLQFFEQLDQAGQESLLTQIEKLDFTVIPGWIRDYVKNESPLEIPSHFGPTQSYPFNAETHEQEEFYKKARSCGEKLLSEGKVAGFVVAGGQGTRLGFDGPKGNYPTSQIKNKTLFQLFAETIAAASKKYGTTIPWYIMTSPLNHQATVEIFESDSYYGLGKENVFIFQQGTAINFSLDGKVLLSNKATIACSPDGHGGSLKAIYDSGALADMQKRGIELLSYWQVDNPLVHLFDPLFIGLHAIEEAEMSSRALIKAGPMEKVGNFCLVDGKITVIEYSDLPDEDALRQNADGSLVFELGSIAIHMVSMSFIEKLNRDGFALPIHRALKKISYVDETGSVIEPTEPNGVKLETFVFDALPLASKSIILKTERGEEFAPVKNAVGTDSAEVTRQMMTERAASWLEYAGVKVPRKADGSVDCVIEMAAGFALCPEDVKLKAGTVPAIKSGDEIYLA